MQVYIITAVSLLLYLTGAWLFGSVLNLQGSDLWILRIGLSILGILAAAVFLLFYTREQRREKGTPEAAPGPAFNDIDSFLRNADLGLASPKLGRGAKLRNLPAFLILGESHAAKTTTIVESGLQLEQIAGQVGTGRDIVPTEPLNCWYGENVVFLEPGGRLQADPQRWAHLLKRLKPTGLFAGQGGAGAARAVLLCCSMDSLLSLDHNGVTAAARNFRTQLEQLSEALGIRVPVYVLFTKSDLINFFTDFLTTFTAADVDQVLGVTLPLQYDQNAGLYAERTTELIATEFRNLVLNLADRRVEVLERERTLARQQGGDRGLEDAPKLGGVYEFPREFRKLQNSLVQFLVEVCKPSQLKIGPFLRGFYFSGVRPVATSSGVSAAMGIDHSVKGDLRATRVFRPGEESRAPRQQAAGSGRVPQWTFLRPLFKKVLLRDSLAFDSSRFSVRTNMSQRIALGALSALAIILIIGTTISFFGNRVLVAEVAEPIGRFGPNTPPVPASSDLSPLDSLAQTIRKLESFERNGIPWRLRWGLYTGDDLYSGASKAYFDRLNRVLLQSVQSDLSTTLNRVGIAAATADDFKRMFDALKAYLMITTEAKRTDSAFLSPYLLRRWTDAHNTSAETLSLIKNQFDFLSEQLKAGSASGLAADPGLVDRVRRYLRAFGGAERIYQAMLAEAQQTNRPIQFSQRFPESKDVVVVDFSVGGEFTKEAWKTMQDAFRQPERYFGGEQWVLGEGTSAAIDPATTQQLRNRYTSEYIGRWRQFLRSARMIPFKTSADASAKLMALSRPSSPLLQLFFTAADNTAVDNPDIKRAFQIVHLIAPPGTIDKPTNPTNQGYMNALVQLQIDLDQIVSLPPATPIDPQVTGRVRNSIQNAKVAERQLEQALGIDSDGGLHTVIQRLVYDPIQQTERILNSLPVAPPKPGSDND